MSLGVYFSKDIHSQEEKKKNQKKAVNVTFYIYIMTKLKRAHLWADERLSWLFEFEIKHRP